MDENFNVLHKQTDGERIVNAIADGDRDALQQAVNGLEPQELQQLYIEINQANAQRQQDHQLPVTVIVNDQDRDGRIDVTGTNTRTGLTFGAEGKDVRFKGISERILDGTSAGNSAVGAAGGGIEGGGAAKRAAGRIEDSRK